MWNHQYGGGAYAQERQQTSFIGKNRPTSSFIIDLHAQGAWTASSLAMKLLIAMALLVIGLSPNPGFSQFGGGTGLTTEATTDGKSLTKSYSA